jgi:hypothetical protein
MYTKDRQSKLLKYIVTQTDRTTLKDNKAPYETKCEKVNIRMRDCSSSAAAVTFN